MTFVAFYPVATDNKQKSMLSIRFCHENQVKHRQTTSLLGIVIFKTGVPDCPQ